MPPTLDRVIEIVAERTGVWRVRLSATSAIDQDIGISDGDVTDLAEAFAAEFGEQIWQWPWQRFALLYEGLSPLFVFQLIPPTCHLAVSWQLPISQPLRAP